MPKNTDYYSEHGPSGRGSHRLKVPDSAFKRSRYPTYKLPKTPPEHPTGMRGRHLFILDEPIISSVSAEVIASTVADLKSLDLYHLPYERVSVRVPTTMFCNLPDTAPLSDWMIDGKWKGGQLSFTRDANGYMRPDLPFHHYIEFRGLTLTDLDFELWLVNEVNDAQWHPYEVRAQPTETFERVEQQKTIADLLITILATRNTIKSTKHHSLANRGIGTKAPGTTRAYEYVTTITVPAPSALEDDDTVAPGAAKCAHLRRGHVRSQRYGPHLSFMKQIWIEPCFVNGDATYVRSRKAYNVSLRTRINPES